MSTTPPEPQPVELPARLSPMARLRNYFLTGLVIAAPITLTIYIVLWLVEFVDARVKPFIPARYNPEFYLPFTVPGFGLVLALIFITLIGFLTASLLGRTLVAYGETLLGRMPLVRTIYGALKQIFETVVSNRASAFQEVVLVEYPRRGIWAVAFLATSARGEILRKIAARDGGDDPVVAVFLPTTPNPTSGFLLFVRRSELIELDLTIEEGAKLVISAGLVTPDERQDVLARARRKPKTAAQIAKPKPEPVAGAE